MTTSSAEPTQNRLSNSQYSASPPFPPTTPLPTQWTAQPLQPGVPSQTSYNSQNARNVPMYNNNSSTPGSTLSSGNQNQHMLNKAAADALNPAIATSYDALALLSQAADQTREASRQDIQNGSTNLQSPLTSFASPTSTNPAHQRPISNKTTPNNVIDPAMMLDDVQQSQGVANTEQALRAWSRMRFVRAGWFTAQEAMDYLD